MDSNTNLEIGIKIFELPLTPLQICYLFLFPNHSLLIRHPCFIWGSFYVMESEWVHVEGCEGGS
jgi:hypothetical protein